MNLLVLGADKGLGAILVKMALDNGYKVAAGYYDLAKAETDARALSLQMDTTKEEQLQAAADAMKAEFGGLDAVIDVAGILLPNDRKMNIIEEPMEDIAAMMNVNALGLLLAFRKIYPIMNQNGRFFAVTSEGGSFTLAGTLFAAYGVSKTAANKFVQTLRLTLDEIEGNTVDLIAVHPGRMNTEMGRTTAQIEPEVSAEGFMKLLDGTTPVNSKENWFIDYQGKPMPV